MCHIIYKSDDADVDSDAVRRRRPPRTKDVKKMTKIAVRAPSKKTHSVDGRQWLYRAKPRDVVRGNVKSISRYSMSKAHSAKQQAAFMDWWREGRVSTLQPRGAEAPTAKERTDALRHRIATKNVAASA